jgi:hypothetical protein
MASYIYDIIWTAPNSTIQVATGSVTFTSLSPNSFFNTTSIISSDIIAFEIIYNGTSYSIANGKITGLVNRHTNTLTTIPGVNIKSSFTDLNFFTNTIGGIWYFTFTYGVISSIIYNDGTSVNPPSLPLLYTGLTLLSSIFLPRNISLNIKQNIYKFNPNLLINSYKFYSSNHDISEIDLFGNILGKKVGKFYIIVTDMSGSIIYTTPYFIEVN